MIGHRLKHRPGTRQPPPSMAIREATMASLTEIVTRLDTPALIRLLQFARREDDVARPVTPTGPTG